MPSDAYSTWQNPNNAYQWMIQQYQKNQSNQPVRNFYNNAGATGANWASSAGGPTYGLGLSNLASLLANQGRVDPRLLANAQIQNSRSTQQQQTAAMAAAQRSGYGNSGLAAALNAAIGSAGANRSANLTYQDLADSYGRNQQNLGLLSQLVINPLLGFGSLGQQAVSNDNQQSNANKAAKWSAIGNIIGGIAGGFL